MSLPRQTFSGRWSDLDFAMEMPVGFYQPDLPADQPDLSDPAQSVPLMLTASPIALAMITVAARPGYADGSVSQWFEFLCEHFGIRIESAQPGRVGGLLHWHPAIIATGTQVQEGVELAMSFVALEDGGRLLTAHALCPRELEPSYMGTLVHCIRSLELAVPAGPTVPLLPGQPVPVLNVIAHDPNRPPPKDQHEVWERESDSTRRIAIDAARPLALAGEYDRAEAIVKAADDSILGTAALGRLYTQLLSEMVNAGPGRDRQIAEVLFRRALMWRTSAYPDPHTEVEAENFERGAQQDRAELVSILGYDPGDRR